MKLKVDESGNAVLNEGKPVYVMDDDKEFVADVPSMYSKTLELKGEAKRYRETAEQIKSNLELYQSLFPEMESDQLTEWKQKADNALNTIQNLDDKKLLDAGKVEQIKAELKDAHDKNLLRVKNQFNEEKNSLSQQMQSKDSQIFQLLVGNAFANSNYFSGKNPKTVLPPDAALALFKNNFKVETDKSTGEPKVVGYYNGAEILSRQPDMVGEIAPVEEAIEYIIEKYPHKDRIMSAGLSGSGAGGGESNQGGTDEISKLQKQYEQALKNNDGKTAIILKNKIYNAQNNSNMRRAV
jgi:hypothetical protein